MSGYSHADRMLAEDTGSDFPAVNNITVAGYLPSDQVPAAARSRSLPEAHFKSLRLFRKYCRYMPFIIGWSGYQKYTNPEMAKLQLANYWRQQNKIRDIHTIDNFVRAGNERLYNIQQGDVWAGIILDQIAPQNRGMVERNSGFSYHEEVKFQNKSKFLKDFYTGNSRKNVF